MARGQFRVVLGRAHVIAQHIVAPCHQIGNGRGQEGATGPQRIQRGFQSMGEAHQAIERKGGAPALDRVDAPEDGVEIVLSAFAVAQSRDGFLGGGQKLGAFLEIGVAEP
jgi:hypothetical protein